MLAAANDELKHEPSPTPNDQNTKQKAHGAKHVHFPPEEKDDSEKQRPTPNVSRKRTRSGQPKDELVKKEQEEEIKQEEAATHSAKRQAKSSPKSKASAKPKTLHKSSPKASTSKSPKAKGPSEKDWTAGAEMASAFVDNRDSQRAASDEVSSARQAKNPYGLSPGVSPYPSYSRPTPEECHEVNRILQEAHGAVAAPKSIPTPSLNSSGCGEVPSILDALIRTRLSAATNNQNSSRAFRGLVERFGVLKEGVGKGSVDWDAVRRAPQRDVFEAIKTGGLADVKSRDIQKILALVRDENEARRAELERGAKGELAEVEEEAAEERDREVQRVQQGVLSLDHLHLLDNDTAFRKLIGYPGIGPKTASCVLLFCMQRPSFAVDTHVFRLTKWLGWVPTDAQARRMARARAKERGATRVTGAQVTRETTYAHLDVRIPDELKYPLHYLLIRHGKVCGWCSAKAGKDARVGVCPVAHLMRGKGRAKGLAKKEEGDEEVEEEEDDEDEDEQDRDEEMHGMYVGQTVKSEEKSE